MSFKYRLYTVLVVNLNYTNNAVFKLQKSLYILKLYNLLTYSPLLPIHLTDVILVKNNGKNTLYFIIFMNKYLTL